MKNEEMSKIYKREIERKRKKGERDTDSVAKITGIQQNGIFVKFWKFRWPDCDKSNSVFPVTVKGCIRKGFSLVFSEKAGVTENYMINLVAGTFTVQSVPLFLRLLTFSTRRKIPIQNFPIFMRRTI